MALGVNTRVTLCRSLLQSTQMSTWQCNNIGLYQSHTSTRWRIACLSMSQPLLQVYTWCISTYTNHYNRLWILKELAWHVIEWVKYKYMSTSNAISGKSASQIHAVITSSYTKVTRVTAILVWHRKHTHYILQIHTQISHRTCHRMRHRTRHRMRHRTRHRSRHWCSVT